MKTFLTLLLLLVTQHSFAYQRVDGLYVDTFGDSNNQALIFVHGGPGHNSYDFQASTADTLSKRGYYVVVYDQRGQGRNESGEQLDFTYDKYADDLKAIIDTLKLNNPTLIAHSHGGLISIKFDKKYPNVAKSIVLVGAPLNFWSTIESMVNNCIKAYKKAGQDEQIKDVDAILESLSKYAKPTFDDAITLSKLFVHGMKGCSLYVPSNPTDLINPNSLKEFAAKDKKERPDGHKGPFADPMKPMPSFLLNENYIKINELEYVRSQKGRFFGMYGADDGLFQKASLSNIQEAISKPDGKQRFLVIDGASHNIYSDRQRNFLKALDSFLK